MKFTMKSNAMTFIKKHFLVAKHLTVLKMKNVSREKVSDFKSLQIPVSVYFENLNHFKKNTI